MDIKITNNVRTVIFVFTPKTTDWSILVNGDFIKERFMGDYFGRTFANLDMALRYAKKIQIIPEHIKAKDLLESTTISIKS